MNNHDKNNLIFLMQLTELELIQWFMDASEDDREYAQELFEEGRQIALDSMLSIMPDYPDARQVLSKFTGVTK
jgi:hypothetical protein